jgi:peptidoglycan hydrolase CwlO-like protein
MDNNYKIKADNIDITLSNITRDINYLQKSLDAINEDCGSATNSVHEHDKKLMSLEYDLKSTNDTLLTNTQTNLNISARQEQLSNQVSALAGSVSTVIDKVTTLSKREDNIQAYWLDIVKNVIIWAVIAVLGYLVVERQKPDLPVHVKSNALDEIGNIKATQREILKALKELENKE